MSKQLFFVVLKRDLLKGINNRYTSLSSCTVLNAYCPFLHVKAKKKKREASFRNAYTLRPLIFPSSSSVPFSCRNDWRIYSENVTKQQEKERKKIE